MRNYLVLLLIISLFFAACTRVPAERPPDFSLSLYWDTGSLPPKYRYEYVIAIGPGNQGQLVYQAGYDTADESLRRVSDFTLADERLDELYTYLNEQGVFTTRWKIGRKLIGGSNTSLIVTAFAREYRLPSLVEFSDEQRTLARETIEGVATFVPESIWTEMDAFQEAYEQSSD